MSILIDYSNLLYLHYGRRLSVVEVSVNGIPVADSMDFAAQVPGPTLSAYGGRPGAEAGEHPA